MTAGLSNRGFQHDLYAGHIAEDTVAKVLFTPHTKIEIKEDLKADETGNVFIEYEQPVTPVNYPLTSRNPELYKPSGIAVTDADIWITKFSNGSMHVSPIENIKVLFSLYKWMGKIVWGGDYDNFHGVLIPIDALRKPIMPTTPTNEPDDTPF